ncbi:DUF4373 domain-containing protein [Dyadobacter sp. CY327]|uniref:Lin1244/Lin1753 domain-containing protein n=1 Tax=Dyadobacter sp. CY327 TaxID=2907301 RepID=UPI001F1C5A0A|nr:Lin1244/Lin1753 domain-containing protein [Dyadobacter sp. CY327]MCE7072006.1 DUF4373 domain-containing protein [Dyadobacter sp. CY327]
MKKKQIWHNAVARKDPRMIQLRDKYGLEGIGLYWMIIEIMYKTADKKLLLLNDPRLVKEGGKSGFLHQLDFLMDCVNEFGLFVHDGVHFWSDLKDGNIFVYQEEYPGDSIS